MYLRTFSKQSLSIIQWAALFFPICYHKVILQDATAISLSRTHFTGLMKTITLYNILETFTTHSELHENPASLQVIFQYCLNGSDAGRESKWFLAGSQTQTFWRWVMTKELLLSLFSSFWTVLCNFPSFLPTGDPERTVTVLRFAFNNFYSLKKCLLPIEAESSLGHSSTWLC